MSLSGDFKPFIKKTDFTFLLLRLLSIVRRRKPSKLPYMVPGLTDAGIKGKRGAQTLSKGSFKLDGFPIKALLHPVVQPVLVKPPHPLPAYSKKIMKNLNDNNKNKHHPSSNWILSCTSQAEDRSTGPSLQSWHKKLFFSDDARQITFKGTVSHKAVTHKEFWPLDESSSLLVTALPYSSHSLGEFLNSRLKHGWRSRSTLGLNI